MFKTQIYPFGYEKFTKMLFDKLSSLNKVNSLNQQLQFPVTVRGDLPERSVQKFAQWVSRVITDPPVVNTMYRCRKFREVEDVIEEDVADYEFE